MAGYSDRRRLATDPPPVRRGDRGGPPRRLSSWNGSSPGGMRPRSRPWSSGTGRWSWAPAGRCSATPTMPRTPSRPRSWSWSARRRSIRGQETLGGWLHQVAHRIAVQAGAEAVRRRARERRAGLCRAGGRIRTNQPMTGGRSCTKSSPDSRRSTGCRCLLCDLEGKTHAQAAEELRLRRGDRPAPAHRRPRPCCAPDCPGAGSRLTAGALATTLGRSALAHVPPAWVEATVRAAGAIELARRADRGRRHGLHGGRESRTQVVTYHVIESIERRSRPRSLVLIAVRRDRLGSRAGRTGQGRAPSSGRDAGSPSGTRRIPGPGADEPAGGARGHDRLSGPGPRPGRASPSRGLRCTW